MIATKGRPFAKGQVARFRGHHMSISDRVFGERTALSLFSLRPAVNLDLMQSFPAILTLPCQLAQKHSLCQNSGLSRNGGK